MIGADPRSGSVFCFVYFCCYFCFTLIRFCLFGRIRSFLVFLGVFISDCVNLVAGGRFGWCVNFLYFLEYLFCWDLVQFSHIRSFSSFLVRFDLDCFCGQIWWVVDRFGHCQSILMRYQSDLEMYHYRSFLVQLFLSCLVNFGLILLFYVNIDKFGQILVRVGLFWSFVACFSWISLVSFGRIRFRFSLSDIWSFLIVFGLGWV